MNAPTLAVSQIVPTSARETTRAAFVRSYPSFRRELCTRRELGLLLVGCEVDGAVTTHWLPAVPHHTTAAIVGRHDHASLVLPQSAETISLRHLAITCRATSLDELRLRVLDLGTTQGFGDEEGSTLRSITAEGSVFLRLGARWIMALVTGGLTPTSDDPKEAYESIPERVFLDEEHSGVRWRVPDRGRAARRPDKSGRWSMTTVMPHRAPIMGGALIDVDETPVGRLSVEHRDVTIGRNVGARALKRGVLVGRYERCQLCLASEASMLSRVHLLLMADTDGVIAVDTASTYGTRSSSGEPIKTCRLDGEGRELHLPDNVLVRWERAPRTG